MPQLQMGLAEGWSEYELLDTGKGQKLERFGRVTVVRPDPQIIWSKRLSEEAWQAADATFRRTEADKGRWQIKGQLPQEWPVKWQDLTFIARLTPFKHTGIFPEQSYHWLWMRQLLEQRLARQPDPKPHVLNLFAYTGAASIVAAKAGAKITHLDASRSAIGWAKSNQAASGLDERSIRWILDDAVKFVSREIKRGVKYEGIVMDPPIYGHGPNGERWDLKTSLPKLVEMCRQILSPSPLFFLINAYAVSTSAVTLYNLVQDALRDHRGETSMGELVLKESSSERTLSTGIWARWQTAKV